MKERLTGFNSNKMFVKLKQVSHSQVEQYILLGFILSTTCFIHTRTHTHTHTYTHTITHCVCKDSGLKVII